MTAVAEPLPDVTLDLPIPCEHSEHAQHHTPPDEPAKYYVLVECHECGHVGRYHLCQPGLDRMTSEGLYLWCRVCKTAEPWQDCLWVLRVLP